MQVHLAFRNLIGGVALAAALAPAAMQAQQRTLFNWTGASNQTVDVTIQGSSVSQRVVAGSQGRASGGWLGRANRGGSVSLQSALPQQDGIVRLSSNGNGTGSVIQQPSSGNGYTAIVRLGSSNNGNGGQVTAYWSPSNGSNVGTVGNGRNGRNSRNGRDSNVSNGRQGRGNRDRNGNSSNNGNTDADDRNNNSGNANGGYGNNSGNNNGGYGNNNGGYGNNNGGYGNNNGAGSLHWYGDVDGVTQLSLRGSQLTISNLVSSSRNVAGNDAGVTLPSRPTTVSVSIAQGRGNVAVVQQPTASNGYTAIVRVTDAPSGYGHYDFNIVWR